jgi:methylated-DNA-protein-cysteine methyltransferase-like protein
MKKELTPLFLRSVALIKAISRGKILSYSEVAKLIGANGCARHVSYILSSSSKKYELPWQRVLNSKGCISLQNFGAGNRQEQFLLSEGIVFEKGRVNFDLFLWHPSKSQLKKILSKIPEHIPYSMR